MSAALSPEPDEPAGSGLPGDGWDATRASRRACTSPRRRRTCPWRGSPRTAGRTRWRRGRCWPWCWTRSAGQDGTGLAGLSDDQLVGFLSGTRRMESRLAWAKMAALAEFAVPAPAAGFRRRRDRRRVPPHLAVGRRGDRVRPRRWPVGSRSPSPRWRRAGSTRCTSGSSRTSPASCPMRTPRWRMRSSPGRRRARRTPSCAGPRAGWCCGSTPTRSASARRRRRREARVRAFREESGNAGISGRELPSVEVLASMQHVEDRARALRDAGVPGTWEELKVRATLDLLQERDSRQPPGRILRERQRRAADGPAGRLGRLRPGGPDHGQVRRPGRRLRSRRPQHRRAGHHHRPATALGGDTGPAGEVDGFGILDHADTRDLVAAAARNPATRWCLTALHPDGTAAAHACAAGPRPWRTAHGTARTHGTRTAGTGDPPRPPGLPGHHQAHPGHPRTV